MTTFLFPGQGSQAVGMGGDLFARFDALTAKADKILGYSIAKLCLSDPQQQLNLTQFTQPALYTVNALMYFHRYEEDGKQPDFVAGHSLGEYNALLAAGVFDFETGLRLVQKRGELMSQAANGGMAAVIGLPAQTILDLLAQNNLTQVSIANYNSHKQLVISGQKDQVEQAQGLCQNAGAMMVVPLKVSGAFHSPLMQTAQAEFAEFIKSMTFNAPLMPVIANLTAAPYAATDVAKNLAEQISNPVRWTDTIMYLTEQGENILVEIGPGNVLTGLVKRIRNGQ